MIIKDDDKGLCYDINIRLGKRERKHEIIIRLRRERNEATNNKKWIMYFMYFVFMMSLKHFTSKENKRK
jgi:hypothetical protein